jgi:hypothetical protein
VDKLCVIGRKQQTAPGNQRRVHEFAAIEATLIKAVGVISTTALFLLLGATVPAFAQEARRKILELLDANHSGTLTTEEEENARIIIYGHSWGGSESLALARALEKDGIPVLLTLQVDSVARPGINDTVIPANVAQAVDFYQSRGFPRGQHDIRAADPARTRIIGNFRFDYETSPLKCSEYPWCDRFLVKPHTQIECDPNVWNQVESLIRLNLPPLPPQTHHR